MVLLRTDSGHHPLPRLPRVMVVHADVAMVKLLREMFVVHHWSVVIEQAVSDEMATGMLLNRRWRAMPGLIIIGLGLHHQNGFKLLHFVRSDHRLANIPTIVLAQCPQLQDERRALAIGADFYLEHPAGVEDFGPLVCRCRELIALNEGADTSETQSAG